MKDIMFFIKGLNQGVINVFSRVVWIILARLRLVGVIFLGVLMITQPLYGLLRGKVAKVDETDNIWIYANDKGERSLSFIAFENVSKDENFDSFRSSIPKAIAEVLRNYETLRLPEEDYIPTLVATDKYQLFKYSYADLGTSFSYEEYEQDPALFRETLRKNLEQAKKESAILADETPQATTTAKEGEELGSKTPSAKTTSNNETPAQSAAGSKTNETNETSKTNETSEIQPATTNAATTSPNQTEKNTTPETAPTNNTTQQQSPPPPSQQESQSPQPANQGKEDSTARTDQVPQPPNNTSGEPSQSEPAKKELTEAEKFQTNLISSKFAYLVRDDNTSEYVIYHFKENPSQYIDAHLLSEQSLAEISIPTGTFPNGITYFALDTYSEKKLKIENSLYYLQGIPLLTAVESIPSDYIVYGTYKAVGTKIDVSMYLIFKQEKKVAHIFLETFPSFRIGEELKKLAVYVIGYLEQRDVIEDIRIEANEKDVLFTLGDQILGRLPLNIGHLVENTYDYEVSKPGYRVKNITSELPIGKKGFTANQSSKTIAFEFEKDTRVGDLSLSTGTDIPVSFYINEQLKAVNSTSFVEKNLLPGSYFVKLESDELGTRNFKLDVFPNTTTELTLASLKKSSRKKRKVNYGLGARISAAIGLTLLGAFFINRARTVELEDTREAVRLDLAQNNNDEVLLEEYLGTLNSRISDSQAIDVGLLTTSISALLAMMFLYSFDVWKNKAPIETKISTKGDVTILYKKRVSF
ncbi:hypothetical protein COTS27_00422 [Spirochaetota bacterium]|nr:hypothetical protein COTS27_00422 [Spirochaetota bacterium]